MKKLLYASLILLNSICFSQTYSDANLVGYWPLDGDGTDLSGNGNTATPSAGMTVVDGLTGSAFQFNGTSDYLDVGTLSGFDDLYGDITYCSWIKPMGAVDDYFIILDNFQGSERSSLMISNGNKLSSHLMGGSAIYGLSDLARDEWQHVALTIDRDGEARFYINGELDQIAALPSAVATTALSPNNFKIGVRGDMGDHWFDGIIDEVFLFNRTLTGEEIADISGINGLINAPVTNNGLVAHWPMNGDGNDISGNANNASSIAGMGTVEGKFGSALEFDGVTDYLDVGYLKGIQDPLGDYSYSFWIKPTGAVDDHFMLIDNFKLTERTSFLLSNANVLSTHLTGGTIVSGTSNLSRNEWHHVVLTVDRDGDARFYIDAALDQTFTIPASATSTPFNRGNFKIGVRGDLSDHWFQGAIDEAYVFSRVLSENEISNLFQYNDLENNENLWQSNGQNIFYNDGHVGIGTSNPTARLTVDGPILATEVTVKIDVSTYPDFVFYDDYVLRSLEEVEEYISKNGHLPEIPKLDEVTDGVNLGEMNSKLLQKIEELTVYLIKLNKQVSTQSDLIETLNLQNLELNQEISDMKKKLD